MNPPASGKHGRVALQRCWVVACAAVLASCAGRQSMFTTFGSEAETTRTIALWMFGGAALITAGVLALAFHAARSREGALDHRRGMRVILWLGGIGPALILGTLLGFSLPAMRGLTAAPNDLTIAVTGEQFWWRVRYLGAQGVVETANELRVPVGRTVTFLLSSPDVIHSFWVPGLAGKVDMIPGRTNELVARATRTGVYRGACAEFCGLSHANMAFDVIAMEAAAFDDWLAAAAAPAAPLEHPGRELFVSYGCSACHEIRGHSEGGGIGPELTHFAGKPSFAAGILPLETAAVAEFIVNSALHKPGSLMPAFETMPDREAAAIAEYLLELR